MTTEALRRTTPPKGPRLSAWVAVSIECAIACTFFAHGSLLGLLLCAAYGWFSATWAVLAGRCRDD